MLQNPLMITRPRGLMDLIPKFLKLPGMRLKKMHMYAAVTKFFCASTILKEVNFDTLPLIPKVKNSIF